MNGFSENLSLIRDRIAAALATTGRAMHTVRLMAVSKTQGPEAIGEALAAGQRLFGENRVQEAAAKFPALRAAYKDLELHLIGPLQTNKVRQAVALFDAIQTLDRPRLAIALAQEMQRQGRYPRLYVEVNIGQEPQKAGLSPNEVEAFILQCRQEWGLEIHGLMAIPPEGLDPRPYFTEMKRLADRIGLAELSMGMSGDFEPAVEAGATLVRVGTALFGARKKPQTQV